MENSTEFMTQFDSPVYDNAEGPNKTDYSTFGEPQQINDGFNIGNVEPTYDNQVQKDERDLSDFELNRLSHATDNQEWPTNINGGNSVQSPEVDDDDDHEYSYPDGIARNTYDDARAPTTALIITPTKREETLLTEVVVPKNRSMSYSQDTNDKSYEFYGKFHTPFQVCRVIGYVLLFVATVVTCVLLVLRISLDSDFFKEDEESMTTLSLIKQESMFISSIVVTELDNEILQFTPSLNDKTSSDYQLIASEVEMAMDAIYSRSDDYIGSEVIDIRDGSVIVDVRLTFQSSRVITSSDVQDTIETELSRNGGMIGGLMISPDNIVVTELGTTSTVTPMTTTTLGVSTMPTSIPQTDVMATDRPETDVMATDMPEAMTTYFPGPMTTSLPEDMTTSLPEAITTSLPEAITTSIPQAITTSIPQAITTSIPEAITTSIPDATTTSLPEAITTSIPEAMTTSLPEAITTSLPEVMTTSLPEAMTTSLPERMSTAISATDMMTTFMSDDMTTVLPDVMETSLQEAMETTLPLGAKTTEVMATDMPEAMTTYFLEAMTTLMAQVTTVPVKEVTSPQLEITEMASTTLGIDCDYYCDAGVTCLNLTSLCDGVQDCLDASDENSCIIPTECASDEVSCTDGECINILFMCDGFEDCRDGMDEQSCLQNGSRYCPEHRDYLEWYCDLTGEDCPIMWSCLADGSWNPVQCYTTNTTCWCVDEDGFPINGTTTYGGIQPTCNGTNDCPGFTCKNKMCVEYTDIGDSEDDCGDNSDENIIDCGPDPFMCDSDTCVHPNFVCDGEVDCISNTSDEDMCG